MKNLLALAVLAASASTVSAQLVYEPFNYGSNATGTNLGNILDGGGVNTFAGYTNPNSGTQWFDTLTNAATGREVKLLGGGLTPPTGLTSAQGGSAYSGNTDPTTDHTARFTIGPAFTGGQTVYYSMLFRVTDIGTLGTGNGSFIAGFNNSTGSQATNPSIFAGPLTLTRADTTTTNYQVGVRATATIPTVFDTTQTFAATHDDGTGTIVTGDTVFAVVKVDFNTGSNSHTASMWINPDPATFGAAAPPPTSLVSTGTQSISGSLVSFVLRQGNSLMPAGIESDELRIDTSWAQVTAPSGSRWSGGAGSWSSDPAPWSTPAAPNGAGSFVTFNGTGGAVSLDSAKTVGTLTFQTASNYALSGGSITIDPRTTGVTTPENGAAAINVLATVDPVTGAIQPASHTISSPVTLTADTAFHVASGQSIALAGDLTAAGLNVTKTGPGTLAVNNLRTNQLTIHRYGGTVRIAPNGTTSGTSVVTGLSMPTAIGTAKLDLTNNDLVINWSGATSPANATRTLIQLAYAGGNWTGDGITSSTAADDANKITGLAFGEASSILGLTGTDTATWSGQTVDATSLLVKFTYYGDVDLDGVTDADDYVIVDRGFALYAAGTIAANAARWTDGDFDYNGTVDSADYLAMDKSFVLQSGALSPDLLAQRQAQFGDEYVASLIAAVPEPSTLGLLLAGLPLASRRRRTRSA